MHATVNIGLIAPAYSCGSQHLHGHTMSKGLRLATHKTRTRKGDLQESCISKILRNILTSSGQNSLCYKDSLCLDIASPEQRLEQTEDRCNRSEDRRTQRHPAGSAGGKQSEYDRRRACYRARQFTGTHPHVLRSQTLPDGRIPCLIPARLVEGPRKASLRDT